MPFPKEIAYPQRVLNGESIFARGTIAALLNFLCILFSLVTVI